MRLPRALRYAAVIPFAALCLSGPLVTRGNIKPPANMDAMRDAMEFLEQHSKKGSMLVTDDWDLFPVCFYYNTHNVYAVGLDPMFTAVEYPELWERYRIITRGQSPSKLGPEFGEERKRVILADLHNEFRADYVLVAADHAKLYRQLLRASPFAELVYPVGATSQPPVAIFRLL